MEFLNLIYEKNYLKPISIFILIDILILAISYFEKKIWIVILCLVILILILIIQTIKYNMLPRNKSGEAILVRIIAKDKKEYDDISKKFVDELKETFGNENWNLNVICIPYHLVEKNNYSYADKEKIIKLLNKTKCIFMVNVKVRSEELNDNTKYITEFNLGIIHPTYETRIQKIFQNEVDTLSSFTTRLQYNKENKIEILEFTAKRISIVSRYIIARAYFFSGLIDDASNIVENLKNDFPRINDKMIINSINNLGYEIHILKYYNEYHGNKNMDIIERELELANEFITNTYIYYEARSVSYFLKNRDIKGTLDYLGKCEKINPNGPTKYSKAFIKAYCNKSEGTVFYHYKKAFKIYYPLIELIGFMDDILEEEKDKNMLRFAICLLYLKLGEIKSARETLLEYLANKESGALDTTIIPELEKYYGKKTVKELLENNKDMIDL